jgi:putative membrane protein
MSRIRFTRQFNWRMMLVRTLVNALALLAVSLLPDIEFVEPTVLRVLLVAVALGILNAFIKPIVQFLTLPYIFITYGFAIVIINAIMLLLLNIVVPNMFNVDRFIWAIVGGALMGVITGFLESLFGLQTPILSESAAAPQVLRADPSRAFESRLISEVVGSDEELATELPATTEAQEMIGASGTAAAQDGATEAELITAQLAADDSVTAPQEEE